jgi:large repetitive protein
LSHYQNDIKAEGDWTPLDTCDKSPVHITSDVKPVDHLLADKCLAIQKSAAMFNDTGTPGLTPGDTLLYTLKFQVSDYKTIGKLIVKDFLSNGQDLDLASPVFLTVSDQFGTKLGAIPPSFITQTADLNGAAQFCPPPMQQPQSGTVLTFDVSSAMAVLPASGAPRLNAGILTGGYAAGPGPPNTAATGTIVFRAKVRDDFQFPVQVPHDKYVDKDDPINNCVVIIPCARRGWRRRRPTRSG